MWVPGELISLASLFVPTDTRALSVASECAGALAPLSSVLDGMPGAHCNPAGADVMPSGVDTGRVSLPRSEPSGDMGDHNRHPWSSLSYPNQSRSHDLSGVFWASIRHIDNAPLVRPPRLSQQHEDHTVAATLSWNERSRYRRNMTTLARVALRLRVFCLTHPTCPIQCAHG